MSPVQVETRWFIFIILLEILSRSEVSESLAAYTSVSFWFRDDYNNFARYAIERNPVENLHRLFNYSLSMVSH